MGAFIGGCEHIRGLVHACDTYIGGYIHSWVRSSVGWVMRVILTFVGSFIRGLGHACDTNIRGHVNQWKRRVSSERINL